MNTMQPVKVTFLDGRVERTEINRFNLIHNYLSKLDMRDVASIEFGESIVDSGPAEFRPSGIQCIYRKSENLYYMDIYDKNDKRVASGQFAPVRLQQFGVDLLQQTTYRFTDVQADHDHMKQRLDGLDK